tara:strand:+ start:1817 stop:2062 length:246 start_codon:yes stop_codon:yes gene_type:complete
MIDKKIIEELRAANVARYTLEIFENNESIESITYKAQASSSKQEVSSNKQEVSSTTHPDLLPNHGPEYYTSRFRRKKVLKK